MTYNFDPERWYDNEYAALEAQRRQNALSDEGFQQGLDDLERRYEEMLQRLGCMVMDGTAYRGNGDN